MNIVVVEKPRHFSFYGRGLQVRVGDYQQGFEWDHSSVVDFDLNTNRLIVWAYVTRLQDYSVRLQDYN